jgi:integrase
MAQITKRAAGQWRARVRRKGYPDQSRTFGSRAEAEAWARLIESDIDRGAWMPRTEGERTTLGELLARYRIEISPSKKGSAQEIYRLMMMERMPIAGRILATLRSSDFATLRDARLKTVAAGTVDRDLSTISAVINVARREWGFESIANPIENIKRPKLPQHRNRRITQAEEALLLESAPPILRAVIIILLETAMRAGELVNAKREHLDLASRTLRLPDTKSGKSRTVPLSMRAVSAIRSLPARIDGRLLPYKKTVHLSQQFIYCRKRCAISDLKLHDLRHEALSRLAEKGWSAAELMALSGHSGLGMLSRYVHVTAEHLIIRMDAGY